jgi:hypothetical protein
LEERRETLQITFNIVVLCGLAIVGTAALCLGCIRVGFKMGRMTQDKASTEAKQHDPGQPVFAEEDEWDKAVRGAEQDPDIPENTR